MWVTFALIGGLGWYALKARSAKAHADAAMSRFSIPVPEPSTLAVDEDDDEVELYSGESLTQQAMWTAEPYRPLHYGNPRYRQWRVPNPAPSTTRLLIEDVSLSLNPEYKEWMREAIEDTEWDDVPFRGERATYWPAREKRRIPFINHPNSVFSHAVLAEETLEEELRPTLREPREWRSLQLGRVNHPLMSVSAAVGQYA